MILRVSLVKISIGLLFLLFSNSIFAQITLKQAYKDAFKIGVAVNDDIVSGKDKASQDIAIKHFNTITLENAMKAAIINPRSWRF